MPVEIREIERKLEEWAPAGTAQSYDNVGLQVGDPAKKVSAALIALDMTPRVLDEAIDLGVDLIVTHHPLIFKPIRQLTPATLVGGLALRLAEAGIALYSIHTNLDAAADGVSFALAGQLGLKDVQFLGGLENSLVKLVTFVPRSHADAVRVALADAGAGQIGAYEACSFSSEGMGSFRPTDGSNPFIGQPGGKRETVEEIRLETLVSRWALPRVLAALDAAHPYEEAAFDIYPVEQNSRNAGIGAIGKLAEPESLEQFLGRVAQALENPALRFTGDLEQMVNKVAVCGGSGSDFIPMALKSEADAYVTSDITYHRFFDVLDASGTPVMALIDPGHYESERITERILLTYLETAFPAVQWQTTMTRTAPVRTFVAG